MKTLVIVESPAKAHKIQEYLGKDYVVLASKGHITDLAKGGKHGLGVDVENNFKPRYVLMEDKIETLDELLGAAKKVDRIFVASDPDREGEAIAWHLAERLMDVGKPIKRVVFNEIKKAVVQKAVKNPRDINMDLFHSQEARRILDRLVGFTVSPFLMNFYGSNPPLSGGRVQSVVTRMIIDREREIENFVPETYWTIQVILNDGKNNCFVAKYDSKITDQQTADAVKTTLSSKDYLVSSVVAQEDRKYPQAPLVTSTLQRIMSKTHGFSADRTMKAAQSLYENGYCTYIRTDSVRVGEEALEEVRNWIAAKYELPKKAYNYKNKEAAQDAHECIRPSDINLLPWDNYAMVDPDEKLVYETIWRCFVASQMMPAVYDTLTVTAHPTIDPKAIVKASGKALKSSGHLEVLGIKDDSSIDIPSLTVGQKLTLDSGKKAVNLEKKQTQPPARYSEDKLIKELVNKGIGRPATYAELLTRITGRNYVEKKGNVFHATQLGKNITDELRQYFTFMDYDYTAKMEQQLDEIESGKVNHIDMLKKFYPGFKDELTKAYTGKGAAICEQCGSAFVLRKTKDGSQFWACTGFPKCRNTKPFTKSAA